MELEKYFKKELIMLIGQSRILNILNKYTLDTFPKSLLLVGDKGSGKHTLVKYVSDQILKLPVEDITENLNNEYIGEIYRRSNPYIYLIDFSNISEKEQNIILKFIEEPLKNSYIIMIAESTFNLLNTIINRCFTLSLDKYTEEELNQIIAKYELQIEHKDLVLKIIKTPGQLINLNLKNILLLHELCEKIIDKIQLANYANTLSISNKINYKDNYDKFDVYLFFDMLIYLSFNKFLINKDIKYFNIYLTTIEYRKKLLDKRINKEYLVQNFLSNIWKQSRYDQSLKGLIFYFNCIL